MKKKTQTKIQNYSKKATKKPICMDRRKDNKSKQILQNSEQDCQNQLKKTNPFFRKIDRHYGSFKTKLLGNYKNIFESLPYKELKPLGINATGCRRKKLTHPSYTALFYANGTIEIKPVRDKGLDPDALQAAFFNKANNCRSLLERRGISTAELKLNRRPKYGYKDKTASFVKQEYKGEDRGMDSTPDPNSVDNYSCNATKRDLRLSSDQNFSIAKARADNPEVIQAIEQRVIHLDEEMSANLAVFAKHLKSHAKSIVKLSEMADLNVKVLKAAAKPKRKRKFPTTLKKSATVRGCN